MLTVDLKEDLRQHSHVAGLSPKFPAEQLSYEKRTKEPLNEEGITIAT